MKKFKIFSGIDEKEIGKRTLEVLELLDLVEVRFAKVKNLSDLWKHRTALARAMILEPDVILMDEPLRNVSPKFHNQLTVLFSYSNNCAHQ